MWRAIRWTCIGLLAWCSLASAQRPSDADAAAVIERARDKAFHYSQSIPDFECTQLIRRLADRGRGWFQLDTLTIRLSYLQHAEVHKLTLINGKPTDQKYEELRGATSAGEFGSVLRLVFDPATEAAFEWKSWKNVRQQRTAVFEYAVSAAKSPYILRSDGRAAVVGIHGAVEIDAATGEVLQLTCVCYDIPAQLNVTSATATIDYDFADVGGRKYLLPVRSETLMRGPSIALHNKMEYRDYHKFTADSVVDFGPVK